MSQLAPALRQSIIDLIVTGSNATKQQIADAHGVSVSTVYRLQREFDEANDKVLAAVAEWDDA